LSLTPYSTSRCGQSITLEATVSYSNAQNCDNQIIIVKRPDGNELCRIIVDSSKTSGSCRETYNVPSTSGTYTFTATYGSQSKTASLSVNCQCQINFNEVKAEQDTSSIPNCGTDGKFNIRVSGTQQNCQFSSAIVKVGENQVGTIPCTINQNNFYCEGSVNYRISQNGQLITFTVEISGKSQNTNSVQAQCKQPQCTFQSVSIRPNSIDCNSGDRFNIETSLSNAQNCNGKLLEIKKDGFSKSCVLDSNNKCTIIFTKNELLQQGFDGQVSFNVYVDRQNTNKQISILFSNCQKASCQVSNINIEQVEQKGVSSCGKESTFHIKITGNQQNCDSLSAIIYAENKEIGRLSCNNIVGNLFNCEGDINYIVSQDEQQITLKAKINNQEVTKAINARCYLPCIRGNLDIQHEISPHHLLILPEEFFNNPSNEVSVDIILKIKDNSRGSCSARQLTAEVKNYEASKISVIKPYMAEGSKFSISLQAGSENIITFRLTYSSQKIKELYNKLSFQDNVVVSVSTEDSKKDYPLSIYFRSDENAYCKVGQPSLNSCRDGLVCLTSSENDGEGKCYNQNKFGCRENKLYYDNIEIKEQIFNIYSRKLIWWEGAICCDKKEFCDGYSACGVSSVKECKSLEIKTVSYYEQEKCFLGKEEVNCAKVKLILDGTLNKEEKIKIKCNTIAGREFDLVEDSIPAKIYDNEEKTIEIKGSAYKSYQYCKEVKIEFNNKIVYRYERKNAKEECKINKVITGWQYEIKLETQGSCKEKDKYPHVEFYSEKTGNLECCYYNCLESQNLICSIAQENPSVVLTLNFYEVLKTIGESSVNDLGKVKITVCPEKGISCDTFEVKISNELSSAHSAFGVSINKIDLKQIESKNLRVEIQNPKGVTINVPLTEDTKLDLENTIGFGKRVKVSICNENYDVCAQKDYIVGTSETLNLKRGWNLCYIPFAGTKILLENNKENVKSVWHLYGNSWLRYVPSKNELTQFYGRTRSKINFEDYEDKVMPYFAAWVYSNRPLTINSIEIKDYEAELEPNKWYLLAIRNITNISLSISVNGVNIFWYLDEKWYRFEYLSNRVWETVCDEKTGKCRWVEVFDENRKNEIISNGNPCKAYFVMLSSEKVKDKVRVTFGM